MKILSDSIHMLQLSIWHVLSHDGFMVLFIYIPLSCKTLNHPVAYLSGEK